MNMFNISCDTTKFRILNINPKKIKKGKSNLKTWQNCKKQLGQTEALFIA